MISKGLENNESGQLQQASDFRTRVAWSGNLESLHLLYAATMTLNVPACL